MDQSQIHPPLVSVIIPAFNEEATIARVIAAARTHPQIGEIIVVDDGSSDATSQVAKLAGAQVIRLQKNGGKGAAMDAGVRSARHAIICFLDADVGGLNRAKLDAIISPVLEGHFDMFVGIRARKTYWMNKLLRITPILGGERVMKKEIWEGTPLVYKKNFQIEIALNYHTKILNKRMGFIILPNLTHVIKEQKHGLVTGLFRRCGMMWDIFSISIRLYCFDRIKRLYALRLAQLQKNKIG